MFILHHSEDSDRLKNYIDSVTFQGHPRSKVMVPNERCMFLSMNNCNNCLSGTISKILALFYQKNSLYPVTLPEMYLMTPRVVKYSAHDL